MLNMQMQQTIKNNISFSGVGIHTGVSTKMMLKPAKEDYGIRFIRIDLENKPEIKVDVDNVFDTQRSTSLKKENAEIHTVEHILAAITGAEIDNLIIEVDNIEIPILDGSAKDFSYEIEKAGITIQKAKRKYFTINRTISLTDEETGAKLIATPSANYEIDIEIDYNSKTLGKQNASIKNISHFQREIA